MKTELKIKLENAISKPTYKQPLPKRKSVPERKKIRQLLRSMLPMEEEQRQYQEEQNFYYKRLGAQ
ncbi:hypothetical protein [Pedobacter psychroterrae]|uniref:Uncharacterized protein n=1 Tax=Pedobacter psychroterrae TaxID=2530453 RepID=A0A4R0NQ52_9SPHI|nr:hypothetical protein [Pedobacter psychroterrae]TCD03131.1 hypothetical protein EZ437_03920 [Pedobacter psychroterrae]